MIMATIPTVTIKIAAQSNTADATHIPLIEQMWYVLGVRAETAHPATTAKDDGMATIIQPPADDGMATLVAPVPGMVDADATIEAKSFFDANATVKVTAFDDGNATIEAKKFDAAPVAPARAELPRRSASFGFVADCECQGQPFSLGRPIEPEDRKYGEPTYSRTVDISEDQYHAMQNLIYDPDGAGFDKKFHGVAGGGIAFGWKAMEVGGMNPEGYDGGVAA
jgi:hypothetical protein